MIYEGRWPFINQKFKIQKFQYTSCSDGLPGKEDSGDSDSEEAEEPEEPYAVHKETITVPTTTATIISTTAMPTEQWVGDTASEPQTPSQKSRRLAMVGLTPVKKTVPATTTPTTPVTDLAPAAGDPVSPLKQDVQLDGPKTPWKEPTPTPTPTPGVGVNFSCGGFDFCNNANKDKTPIKRKAADRFANINTDSEEEANGETQTKTGGLAFTPKKISLVNLKPKKTSKKKKKNPIKEKRHVGQQEGKQRRGTRWLLKTWLNCGMSLW